MSDRDDELELQALERRLDDAFQSTRPRPAFEDELWARMQASRPVPRRLREAIGEFLQGIRAVPAVPAAGIAALMVVVIGVGVFALGGAGRSHDTATSGSTALSGRGGSESAPYSPESFGRLPSPVFSNTPKAAATPGQAVPATNGADYAGPVQLVWSGTYDLTITSAPVFRYSEPGIGTADRFAASLGAVLRDRPEGFLGSYAGSNYTLKVRGTVRTPVSSPTYFISSVSMPPVDVAGGPQAVADVFLAEHSLQPQWPFTVSVDSTGDPIKVRYERQFEVPGLGPVYVVDFNATRYGIEVDMSGNRPVLASGVLQVGLDVAGYRIVSAADAIKPMLTTPSAGPVVQLNHAELVYVLVPAGDHSFYEPAFLFSGQLQTGGQSYTRHVLVPAVDPSQRTP